MTLILTALSATSLNAQGQSQAPNAGTEPVLAKELAPARGLAKLTVTSAAFQSGAHWRVSSENTPTEAKLDSGAMQGLNVRKAASFVGPKPPAGQMHPYHFEVFALNKRLNIDPATADRTAVLAGMKGHVLALGDLSAYYTGK